MAARHAFLLAGSLWEAVRFFVVLSLLAQVFSAAGGASIGIIPWLLLGGTGNLLVPVGGIMLSLFPLKYGEMIRFLRLGKVLSVFSFVLLAASGALGISMRGEALRIGPVGLTQGAVLFAVFVLDIAFLVILIAWRREKPPALPAATQQ
ncbi:MAG: hypothetical protein ACLQCB_21765 [Spirochaetia bacterium]